jgi:hypothetical protein
MLVTSRLIVLPAAGLGLQYDPINPRLMRIFSGRGLIVWLAGVRLKPEACCRVSPDGGSPVKCEVDTAVRMHRAPQERAPAAHPARRTTAGGLQRSTCGAPTATTVTRGLPNIDMGSAIASLTENFAGPRPECRMSDRLMCRRSAVAEAATQEGLRWCSIVAISRIIAADVVCRTACFAGCPGSWIAAAEHRAPCWDLASNLRHGSPRSSNPAGGRPGQNSVLIDAPTILGLIQQMRRNCD